MTLKIFVLLLIAHLLGDVVFSFPRLSVAKRSNDFFRRFAGLFSHAVIHGLFAALLLLFSGNLWIKGSLLVLAVHFIIDFFRTGIEIRLFGSGDIYVKRSEFTAWVSGKNISPGKMNMKTLWPWLLINLFDQGAHLGSLYFIARII